MVAALAVLDGPALAVEADRDVAPGTIRFRDSRPGDEEEEESAAAVARARPERHYYRAVLWNANQGFCISWRSTTDRAYADRQNSIGFAIRFDTDDGRPYANCAPRTSAAAAPDLQAIAGAAWEQVEDLPVPSLDIEPDHAVTGKKVYLQISGPTTWSKTIDNPVGDDVVITATSDYVVDWDDPTFHERTITRSQGGPWPAGDVTHVYTDTADRLQIRVTQRWQATWRAGTRSGTLTELSTQAPPLALEVRELQPVRDR